MTLSLCVHTRTQVSVWVTEAQQPHDLITDTAPCTAHHAHARHTCILHAPHRTTLHLTPRHATVSVAGCTPPLHSLPLMQPRPIGWVAHCDPSGPPNPHSASRDLYGATAAPIFIAAPQRCSAAPPRPLSPPPSSQLARRVASSPRPTHAQRPPRTHAATHSHARDAHSAPRISTFHLPTPQLFNVLFHFIYFFLYHSRTRSLFLFTH